MAKKTCRFCDTQLEDVFIDLGMSPLANSFLKNENEFNDEKFFPLIVFVCNKCLLVQLQEFESPEKIFGDYAYFSSFSDTWLKHSEEYSELMIERYGLTQDSLVIEIASNDGYLLQFFKKKGIPILGIDPAANIARSAEKKGIPTLVKFFGVETALELFNKNQQADLITANNVLAHVPNLNDFVKGLKILLKPKGVITIEFPHLLELIQQNQFDTIYHEHFSYFSFLTVQRIFTQHNLTIFDVEKLDTHGGSLRIFVKHPENNELVINNRVEKLLEEEQKFGLDKLSSYSNFSEKVKLIKKSLLEFLSIAKKQNKKIVGYGAAAKGNTLLNYCNIGQDYVDFVVDRSSHKQDTFLPGTHIPVLNPEEIKKTKPDYILILPWNLREEIMGQLNFIREWGGKFVISIPEVKIY